MGDKLTYQAGAILLGGFISVNSSQEIRLWILAFFLLLLFRLGFLWKPADFMGRMVRPEIILLVCGLCMGFIYGSFAERDITKPFVVKGIEVEGVLQDWSVDGYGARGIIRLEKINNDGSSLQEKNLKIQYIGEKYRVNVYPFSGSLPTGWENVKPGDRIHFIGNLENPKRPGTQGQFDLPLYNAVRGISGTITAKGEVKLVTSGVPTLTWKIRTAVREVLDYHWAAEGAVLEGILFGDTSRIMPQTLETYKATGVMHVFAASGANVAFLIALVFTVLFFLPPRSKILITLVIIVMYAILCNGNPPILRATILGAAVLLGMLGRGKIAGLRWLMFAGLFLFIYQPLLLKDTSFQLSFAATWGMVVLSPHFENGSLLSKVPQPLKGAAAIAFSTQIATFPIIVDVFYRISLIGLVTNIFALFLLGAVLQLGLIGLVLLMFPGVYLVFFQSAIWLLQISEHLLERLAGLPFAYFWVLTPGSGFWLFWYGLLGIYIAGRKKVWFIVRAQGRKLWLMMSTIISRLPIASRLPMNSKLSRILRIPKILTNYERFLQGLSRRELIRPELILTLIITILLWSPWLGEDTLEVTFLDVGQGDCILIQTPTETLLVDTGPRSERYDAGERIIVPFLMEKRIDYLDTVFITHEDNDHIGGANYLLYNIPTGTVAVPDVEIRLHNEAWQTGLPKVFWNNPNRLMKLKAGDQLEYASGLTIEVLAPVYLLQNTSADENNNSLVLYVTYLNTTILLTGDMEQEEMQSISERGAEWDADFIKIPHHGSRGSLDISWFNQTNPQAVFIPVGRNNFGHPAPEVISYWTERGVAIYRTDVDGTIELRIDKRGYEIQKGRLDLDHSNDKI